MTTVFMPTALYAKDTSTNPTPSLRPKPDSVPVGTVVAWGPKQNIEDPDYWIECDGRVIPAGEEYTELRRVFPSGRVPDMKDRFLRGGDTANAGQAKEDTFSKHLHYEEAHTHSVSSSLDNGLVTGTAKGQYFMDTHLGIGRYGEYPSALFGAFISINNKTGLTPSDIENHVVAYYVGDMTRHYTNGGSSVTGSLTSGNAYGTTSSNGGENSLPYGTTETAPQHIRVRYYVRAIR